MKVAIVGTGYVGLVTGACLAELGHEVVCVDVDEEKVARIASGVSPIYEAGLDELLARNVGGCLRASTDLRAAVLGSELTLVAVGTPLGDGEIDLGESTTGTTSSSSRAPSSPARRPRSCSRSSRRSRASVRARASGWG
jgi:UDP-glucose 6-dehydrogenase